MQRFALVVVTAMLVASAGGAPGLSADNQTLYLSPSGSDSGSCTQSAPCLSFARAYQVASPGATVLVTCGKSSRCSYPAQSIPYTLAKRGSYTCRAAETFPSGQETRDDPSGCTTFRAGPDMKPSIASVAIEVPYVQLQGLDFSRGVFAGTATARVNQPCSTWDVHDLILRDVTAADFVFDSVSYAYVLGGSYGPLLNDASKVEPCTSGSAHTGGGHIAIDGVTMHDYRQTDRAAHMECIHFQQGDDSLIVRSRFLNCAQQDLSVQTQGGSSVVGLLVEDDVFDAACSHAESGDVCGIVSGGTTTFICNATGEHLANVTIRYNSMNGSPSFQRQQSCSMGDIAVRGNIVEGPPTAYSCTKEQQNGVAYAYNAFTNTAGPPCGAGNRLGATASSTWVDPGRYDYHLKASSRAIELVPVSAAQRTSVDIDGSLRPPRWRSDAGAYQRETALVVLGRSIGAVSMAERWSSVIAFFGKPQHTETSRAGRRVLTRLVYRVHGGLLWVMVEEGKVAGIGTSSRYYATRTAVGPATSGGGLQGRTKVTWARCGRVLRHRFGKVVVQVALAPGRGRIASLSMATTGAIPRCR